MSTIDSSNKKYLKSIINNQNTFLNSHINNCLNSFNYSEVEINSINNHVNRILENHINQHKIYTQNLINNSTNLLKNILNSIQKSNEQFLNSVNQYFYNSSQEILQNISVLDFESNISPNQLDRLNSNVNSFCESIEQVYEIDSQLKNNISSCKNINSQHKLNIYEIISLVIALLSFLYQIHSDIESSKINQEILNKLNTINLSIQDISKQEHLNKTNDF